MLDAVEKVHERIVWVCRKMKALKQEVLIKSPLTKKYRQGYIDCRKRHYNCIDCQKEVEPELNRSKLLIDSFDSCLHLNHPLKVQNLLMINDMFSVSMVVCRCNSLNNGKYRWKVRFDTLLNPDVTIAVRMKADNESVLDYYLLPSLDFRIPNIKLDEQNTDFLDSYRFANLEYLYQMAKCLSIRGLLQ